MENFSTAQKNEAHLPKGKKTFWKAKVYVGGNIKTDLQETEWQSIEWIELPQDTVQCWSLVNTVISFQLL
jgi:hypothetical protein